MTKIILLLILSAKILLNIQLLSYAFVDLEIYVQMVWNRILHDILFFDALN